MRPSEAEKELVALVDLLLGVAKECDRSDLGSNEVLHYACGFPLKLAHHAASALTLLQDRSRLAPDPVHPRFLDRTSVCVLARAGWECFLLFHHIFVAPASAGERELRWLRWSIESPRARQKYETLLPGQAEQLEHEKSHLAIFEKRIRTSSVFASWSRVEQKKFMGRYWRPGWKELGQIAGAAKLYCQDNYSYLCDHAHTGRFSVDALHNRHDPDAENLVRFATAGMLAIAVAMNIRGLRQLFPNCRPQFPEGAEKLIAKWEAEARHPDPGDELSPPPEEP